MPDWIMKQGETVVGVGTVALSATPMPCGSVWVGAPTANHTAGANASCILVGVAPDGNSSGGRTLEPDDYGGFTVPCQDAGRVYCTGFNEGDAIEWQAKAPR